MRKAAFNSAMSSMVRAMPSTKPALSMDPEGIVSKQARSPIEVAAPTVGSRPSASLKASSFWLASGGVRQLLATRNFVFLMRRALLRRPMAMCGFGPNASHRKNWMRSIQNQALGEKIVKAAVDKIVSGYVPPIVAANIMTFDQMETIVPMELTADADSISPTARIFYELNTSQNLLVN